MRRLWIKFNDMPIFFRLSCVIIISACVLCFFSISNYVTISKEKTVNIEQVIQRSGKETMNQLDSYIRDVSKISQIPLTYRMADQTYLNAMKAYNDSNRLTLDFQKINERMFEEIMAYKSDINSCFVFNGNGYGDYKVKKAIYNVMDPTGVLLINTEVDYIRDIIDDVKVSENHRTILLSDSYTIYDTEEENITKEAKKEIVDLASDTTDGVRKITLEDGSRAMLYVEASELTGWKLISLVPEDEVLGELKDAQKRIVIETVLGIGVMLILLFFIITRISRSIHKLEAVMKLAEQGDFEQHVRVESKDEIGNLTGMFNSMVKQINSLINEVYKQKIYHSELELQMLQAQINPHFLYNALESISMLAIMNDDDQTSEMASNLGHILRYGISNYNAEVSL